MPKFRCKRKIIGEKTFSRMVDTSSKVKVILEEKLGIQNEDCFV